VRIFSAIQATGCSILLASLNKSRPSIAAHARGIARAAFKDMVSYGNERVQSGRAVLDFQGNQFTLADLASELVLVERWIDYVADLVDGNETDFGLEASVAKLRATDLAMKMASRMRTVSRWLRLLPGLPCRAANARRQDYPDLGRHQPDSSSTHRTELQS
jgi:alkylation response protein AidB-like acyl-CoA dehydrogenase